MKNWKDNECSNKSGHDYFRNNEQILIKLKHRR